MEDFLAHLLENLAEVCEAPMLQDPELVDGLLDKVRRLKVNKLREAKVLIETTAQIARAIGSDIEQQADVLSLWGEIARASADWDLTEASYALVRELVSRLPRDHRLHIETDLRRAVLARDLRDFASAEASARGALKKAFSISDAFRIKQSLIVLASILDYSRPGDPDIALLFREAAMIETGTVMDRNCLVSLANTLIFNGNHLDEAAEYLQEAISADVPLDPVTEAHIDWSCALLDAARNEYEPARERLESAVDGFIELDRIGYAAVCLMDLAILHLDNGAYSQAKSLSRRLWPLFQNLRIDREAFTAVNLYMKASARDELTAEIVRGIKRQLELAGPNIPPAHAR